MELFYLPIIIFVVVLLLFVFIIVNYNKKTQKKLKVDAKPTATEEKKEEPKIIKPVDIDIVSRPDFSDMVKIEENKNLNSNKSTSKTLKVSENILNSGNEYRRDYKPRNTKLSNEISNLSPELKAIIFGNILNEDR